jgi:acetoin utilization protein AcuB
MKVNEIMRAPVETIEASEPAESAWKRMSSERIRHLVVLAGDEVVGVLSERDLGGEHGRAVRLGQAVGELMSGEPVIATPQMELDEVATLLSGCRVGCLPVLENERLVGIVTRTDLIDLLAERDAS